VSFVTTQRSEFVAATPISEMRSQAITMAFDGTNHGEDQAASRGTEIAQLPCKGAFDETISAVTPAQRFQGLSLRASMVGGQCAVPIVPRVNLDQYEQR
jgi:hypothetical protein